MLSPLDVLSVAACTAQFLDFSIKVLSKGNELYSSTSGSLEESRIIVETAQRLLEHKERLKACLGIQSQAVPQSPSSAQTTSSPQTPETSQTTSIRQLCQKCFETSDTLIVRLHGLEVPLGAKHRKWKSLRQALKTQWNKTELNEFRDSLLSYKHDLGLYILMNNGEDMKSLITKFQSMNLSTLEGQARLDFKVWTILNNLAQKNELVANEIKTGVAGALRDIGTMRAELELLLRALLTDIASNQGDVIAELTSMMSRLADHSKDMLDSSKEILNNQSRLEYTIQSAFTDFTVGQGGLKLDIDKMAETSKTIETRMDKAERERLLSWLSSVDPSSNYNIARQTHEPQTGNWLIHDESFQSWYTGCSSFLWLHGKAGSGKTILSSSVIKHIKTAIVSSSQPEIGLAYFYFSFSDEEKQAVEEMVCCMVKQLSCHGQSDSPELEVLKKHQEKGHRPDLTTLEAILLSTIRQYSTVYLIVDALDECPFRNSQRKRLMDSLSRIYLAAPGGLKMLCTSRNEPDIEASLKAWFSLPRLLPELARRGIVIDLVAFKAHIDNDIVIYIRNHLDSNEYNSWPETLKHEAKMTLMDRADGMFQYVACQLDILRCLSSAGKIRKALKDLPKGLDATYDRILLNVDKEFQKQVARTLNWLAFSLTPLTLEQLADIFILDPAAQVPFDEEEKLFNPQDVLKYIPGLVTTYDDSWRHPRLRVRLSHFSIKEYLKSDRICQGPAKDFALSETSAHLDIIHSCLVYTLCLSNHFYDLIGIDAQAESSFSLWRYIKYYLLDHLDKTDSVYWNDQIHECLAQIFAVGSPGLVLLCFSTNFTNVEYANVLDKVCVEKLRKDVGLPLYYASIVGSHSLIKWLIGRGANVNQHSVGNYTTPLQAILMSEVDGWSMNLDLPAVVELLVSEGVKINDTGGTWGCALHLAARFSMIDVLKMLMIKGADASLVVNGDHALSTFARFPSDKSAAIEFIGLFLQYGVDINARCRPYGNALQTAIVCHNFDTANVLLDFGAKLDPSGLEWKKLLSEIREKDSSELREFHEDPNGYLERKIQEDKDIG